MVFSPPGLRPDWDCWRGPAATVNYRHVYANLCISEFFLELISSNIEEINWTQIQRIKIRAVQICNVPTINCTVHYPTIVLCIFRNAIQSTFTVHTCTSSFLTVSTTAQADSSRLPTEVACTRSQLKLCGICGGQRGGGTGFLRVLLFPLPIIIYRPGRI
jgi:hypothetical protein